MDVHLLDNSYTDKEILYQGSMTSLATGEAT
jgi:hypothetical protein